MPKNTDGAEITSSNDEQEKAVQSAHLTTLTAALVFDKSDR